MIELSGEATGTAAELLPATRSRFRTSRFVALLVVGLVTVLILFALSRTGICEWHYLCGPLLAEDISQGRLDTALPVPQSGLRIEQTFVPRRDGLSEIELMLVRYGGEATAGGDHGSLLVELRDAQGALVAVDELATSELSHNETYTLRFDPQPKSAGRQYALSLSGNEFNPISAWGYSLDVYEDGELRLVGGLTDAQAAQLRVADMRFIARYELSPGEAVTAAATPLREWRLLLAALLLLPLPGVLMLLAARLRGWDGAAWWGAALSLGLAAWPILWLWVSLAGGRWTGPILWGVVAAGWLAAGATWRRRAQAEMRSEPAIDKRPVIAIHCLLVILVIVTLASRFVAVRDLAFPPWVDSSRHALITAVMVQSGRVPTRYEPILPVDHFPYHYGFHTLSTGLALMTGRSLPGLLLFLMQLLGGLLPLPVYAAGWMVTRRRTVGLLAAFLVALPFFFPGYYATWGRMTQLAAMAIMPVLLALTWRIGRGWPRLWPLVGVLAAGVFLTHFRVFLFFLPFAGLAFTAHLFTYRRVGAMLKAGVLGLFLVLPRVIELLSVTEPLETFQRSLPGYNDFPIGYITTGWERVFLVLAAAGAGITVVALARRRRWAAFPLLLLLWVALLFALLAGDRLGLPESLVVNLNSMYITLFLPLALLLAIIAGRVWGWIDRLAPRLAPAASIAGALGVAVLLVFGWRQQANILNPQTILALPEDVAALDWVAVHLPAGARVAVSAWQWLGATWAGSDGGAWVVPLTGRESTTPPVDHIYNPVLFARSRAFNEAAMAVKDWSAPAAAAWLAEQGVTHVFVGRRGGYFDPAALSRNPFLETIYGHDGTFIFAVR